MKTNHTNEDLSAIYTQAVRAGLCRSQKDFAQQAYSATGDKRLAASLTGHSENSRAFNRYSEVTREMKRKALGL